MVLYREKKFKNVCVRYLIYSAPRVTIMATQTSASRRGGKDVVLRNYETICTKVIELGIEICRSYYVGGSDPLWQKAEDIYLL